MPSRMSLLAVVAVASFALAVPNCAVRAENAPSVSTKKKTKKYSARKHQSAYPGLEPYRSSGFVGQFPGSCAYDRAAGNCMMDLGYGRCVPCDIGGGGGGRGR